MLAGPFIRELRKKQKMTQRKLARLVGIHEVNMCNIEKSRTLPRVATLQKIAKALNVDFNTLANCEFTRINNTRK